MHPCDEVMHCRLLEAATRGDAEMLRGANPGNADGERLIAEGAS